jgi:hypothetical protein
MLRYGMHSCAVARAAGADRCRMAIPCGVSGRPRGKTPLVSNQKKLQGYRGGPPGSGDHAPRGNHETQVSDQSHKGRQRRRCEPRIANRAVEAPARYKPKQPQGSPLRLLNLGASCRPRIPPVAALPCQGDGFSWDAWPQCRARSVWPRLGPERLAPVIPDLIDLARTPFGRADVWLCARSFGTSSCR